MKINRSDRRPSVLDYHQHAVGPSKSSSSSAQGSQKIQDLFESASPSNVSTRSNQQEPSGFFSTGLGKVLGAGAAALAGFGISELIGKLTGKSGEASSASSAASGTGAPGSTPSDGTYAHSDTFQSYGVRNGGRQAWRIPNSGPHFGKSCKVTFSDGTSVVVPDTSKNFRIQSGDKRGFVFKPGMDNGFSDKERDTSTSHHGVYLHAPYGNSSKSVKFEWN